MVPGDHLQLLYHFWLFKDTATGNTPWFYNLYEFNTGNDQDRFQPGTYYLPFSLFYTAGFLIGGHSVGWNLAIIITLWLTLYFTWLLVRRYSKDEIISFAASLVAITLPFVWVSLCGGSPAGFAMMWLPLIFLGFDSAGRKLSASWGTLGGAAVLLASFTDLHVFFFGALAVPLWTALGLLQSKVEWKKPLSYLRICWAIFPGLLLAGLGYWILKGLTSPSVTSSINAGGRSFAEAALFSPTLSGILPWNSEAISEQIYIGLLIITLVAGGLVATIAQTNKTNWRRLAIYVLLLLAATAIVVLALGTNGPIDGVAFRAARKLIAPYRMIRQPAKIFCLMPATLAVICGFAMTALADWYQKTTKSARWLWCLILATGLLMIGSNKMRIQTFVCLLDKEQRAYAAVKYDAMNQGVTPRVLIIPLWPGDSHYSSTYQYYATLYRLRLVNGYTPSIDRQYYDNIFQRFDSANQGILNDEQIDYLLQHKINYIILHENMFPEKVSPLPVAFTLRGLLQHPRLSLLRQDGPIWAFSISPTSATNKPSIGAEWTHAFSHHQHSFANGATSNANMVSDTSSLASKCVVLEQSNSFVTIGPFPVADENNLRWWLRIKGKGRFNFATTINGNATLAISQNIDSPEWIWKELPIKSTKKINDIALSVTCEGGQLTLDTAIPVSGAWRQLQPGEAMSIPAACFYHAGHTDLHRDAVVFRKLSDKSGVVFYGPKLPLVKGKYKLELIFSSPAGSGVVLGEIRIDCPPGNTVTRLAVVSGMSAKTHFTIIENKPVCFFFSYRKKADIALSKVVVQRLE